MKLEDEIKQTEFKNVWQKLVVNLIYTGNWIAANNAEILKPHDISVQQYNVLRILRGQYPEPVSVNVIMDRMLDKMSNASRLVDKLSKKGLAERSPSREDRRRVDVQITREGLDLLEQTDKAIEKIESRYEGQLSTKEAEKLNKLLDKLRG